MIFVTFSNGAQRGFLSGQAAMRYADRRGLSVVSAADEWRYRPLRVVDVECPRCGGKGTIAVVSGGELS